MVDPQQDGLRRYFSVFEAVFLNLWDTFSFDVEMKDGLCVCECFLYSDPSFLSFRPIFPRSFPFDAIIFIYHSFQIIFQVSPNSACLLVPVD